jgi:hypothetical protein
MAAADDHQPERPPSSDTPTPPAKDPRGTPHFVEIKKGMTEAEVDQVVELLYQALRSAAKLPAAPPPKQGGGQT